MGSNSAKKLLERMRRTKSGWKPKDFDTLYSGFGFVKIEKTNHTAYKHPKYPDLYDLVARHGKLADGYASDAVKTIDELKARIEAEKEA